MRAKAVALTIALALPALGADGEPNSAAVPKKNVVLVLSGGGARGSAHIGVLKVLEELHVRPDLIVGTSMGSIIGGLYAAGWSPEEIEHEITTIDWGTVFVDKLPRQYRTFRRKQDDAFLVPIKMRFKNWKPYLPPSVIGGQSLELTLQRFELQATGERNFDEFPIPYRAVAADLGTGEPFVIAEGSLSKAMRASMSVPGIFPPVEMNGRPLCDGGVAANFPVRIAQGLGAETIIGVDISSPLSDEAAYGNLLQRLDQMSSLLTAGNVKDDKAAMTERDILIVPELGDIKFSDFARAKDAIAIGEAAAWSAADRLRDLAVSDAEWAAFHLRHRRRPDSDMIVDRVSIVNTSYLDDRVVASRFAVPVGKPLDGEGLAKQILQLYGFDTFGTIHHDLTRDAEGRNVLNLEVPKKPYSRNSLQFGFNLETDFQGNLRFNLLVGQLMNPINSRGGEWRTLLQFGDDQVLGTEIFQPIDVGQHWFVNARAFFRDEKVDLFDEEGDALAEYNIRNARVDASMGRVLRNWGQAEIGVYRDVTKGRRRIGSDLLPSVRADGGGVFFLARLDTLDAFTWPTDGLRATGLWKQGIESFGADLEGSIVFVEFAQAKKIGKNVFFGSAEFARNPEGTTGSSPDFYLVGGLLRLSGLKPDQLIGDSGGLARLMYYRELTAFSLGSLTQRMFAGASFEVGNAYLENDVVDWASLRRAGSLFVGASTILGPAYFGVGYEESGEAAVYLIIGQRF